MLPIILFFLALSTSFAGKLPAGTVFCKRKDPSLNDCLKSAIQKSLPHFIPGVPELEVESIDPLVIKSLVIDRKKGNGSPVDIDLSWHDVQITGIENAEITDAKADWDQGYVSFNADVKNPVVIKGRYLIDGVVLVLPINGEGNFETKLENFKGHIKVHGKEEMSGGKKYFMVDRLVFTFDVGHMAIKYENLFNGDPVLGESMNNFVNENWRDILDEMKVTVETTFSEHWQAIAEKVFHAVPLDEIALQ